MPEPEDGLAISMVLASSILTAIEAYLLRGPPSELPGTVRAVLFLTYDSPSEETSLMGAVNYREGSVGADMFEPDTVALLAVMNDVQSVLDDAAERHGLERMPNLGKPKQG